MDDPERHGRRLPARAVEILREEGPRGLWIRTLQHTGVYRRVLVLGARRRERREPRVLAPAECLRLGPEHLGDYLALRPDQDPAEIRRRLEAGHRCYAARSEGRLVSARWVATGRVHVDYLDCELVLADDAFYTYDIYAAPAFRGRQVPAAVSAFATRALEKESRRRSVALIWPENRKSHRRSQRRNHFIGTLVRWQLGSLRRVVLTLEDSPDDPRVWLLPGTGRTRLVTPAPRARRVDPGTRAA